MSTKLRDAALSYAAQGIAIFPVLPFRKEPAGTWRRIATTDQNRIEKWWTEEPDYNIGIPTGNTFKQGRRIEVLDIDVKDDYNGRWFLDSVEFKEQEQHAFAKVITPSGGYHYWFRSAEQPSGKLYGVDFKATGGYVLAPPSRVVIHGQQRYSGDYFFDNIRPVTPKDKPFDWEATSKRYGPRGRQGNQRLGDRQYPIELLAEWMENEPAGKRNHELFKKSCIAIESGYRDLKPLYLAALTAGLEKHEIEATIRSAARTYGILTK